MRAERSVKGQLKRHGLSATVRPPPLSPRALLGMQKMLNRLAPSCLERALIVQAWLAAHHEFHDVVIGIPPGGMTGEPAHAWLDGRDPASAATYLELHRLPPPRPPHS